MQLKYKKKPGSKRLYVPTDVVPSGSGGGNSGGAPSMVVVSFFVNDDGELDESRSVLPTFAEVVSALQNGGAIIAGYRDSLNEGVYPVYRRLSNAKLVEIEVREDEYEGSVVHFDVSEEHIFKLWDDNRATDFWHD